ncbi:MAG TPA: amidase [Vicinamibacterales bacterium]|jgi:aspartyl-tRNA(Asn)/glutamyl-tRNA(Gln) amidotransferase subunit A
MIATVQDFADALRARRISASEMLEDCLGRIAADNDRLNAFILVTADEARREAAQADRELAAGRDRGRLHGVPYSVKDIFDVQGMPTSAASRVRDGHRAAADAPAVAAMRAAGAVLVGKANLHEFAFGTTNEESAFGPARHPLDPSRSPGGSSGGSAVSVAAGMSLVTLGTDTGGSIRIPAAACGLVGLKPELGELSTEGVVPLSRTLDHVGPLAPNVADAWCVYQALAGAAVDGALAAAPLAGARIAVPRRYFCELLDPEVAGRFEAALTALTGAGAVVGDAEIPHASLIAPIYLHLVFAEAAAYHAATLETMPERYTPPVRLRLEAARYVMAEDYVRALEGRALLAREVDRALDGVAALALPSLPIPAPPIGAAMVDVGSRREPVRNIMLRLTQLFNITGHPAVSLPCGRTAAGLPVGLQLVGAHGQTRELMQLALAVEALLK